MSRSGIDWDWAMTQQLDPQGDARRALSQAVAGFGAAVLDRPDMLEAALSDDLPDRPRELAALKAAAQAGARRSLERQVSQGASVGRAIAEATDVIAASAEVDDALARWAAAEFALALRLPGVETQPDWTTPDSEPRRDEATMTVAAEFAPAEPAASQQSPTHGAARGGFGRSRNGKILMSVAAVAVIGGGAAFALRPAPHPSPPPPPHPTFHSPAPNSLAACLTGGAWQLTNGSIGSTNSGVVLTFSAGAEDMEFKGGVQLDAADNTTYSANYNGDADAIVINGDTVNKYVVSGRQIVTSDANTSYHETVKTYVNSAVQSTSTFSGNGSDSAVCIGNSLTETTGSDTYVYKRVPLSK